MQLIYSLLLTIIFIALLPYFAYQALVNRKYLSNFRERLGWYPDLLKSGSQPAIWLHAVSVGETLAAQSLVRALRERFPGHRIILSTTTATGQAVARSRVTEADGFCYFPFDWRFCVRRSLRTIDPQIVILMESELWLNFLSECRTREVPVLVANGRVSDRSFQRSQRYSFFTSRLYSLVSRFVMQSSADEDRAIRLGAPPERVTVSGNLKYDIERSGVTSNTEVMTRSLNEAFGLNSDPLIVAGSTGDAEEEIILGAFEDLRERDGMGDVRLMIAPRHPERFEAVARLLESSKLTFARRSSAGGPNISSRSNVILLDTVGELAALYQFASVVFIGGSLIKKGGHNILEAAFYAKPIIVGPHMENFREITREFLRRDAVIQLAGDSNQELTRELRDNLIALLKDRSRAREIGENARKAVDENHGATARTVEAIDELMRQGSRRS
ncbi:MAG: 3-deoxy-D-manno-octulosonic acid transferase [Acidobacteria bacterium]|nr:3-deoxy-D-manno-octulosonic acid transferase [Acidobacteriota bacterium]